MELVLSPLQFIEGISEKRYVLPLVFVLGAILFSKISKVSLWMVFFFGSLPFLLIFLDLPLADSLREEHPLILVLFGWLILMVLAIGRAIARFFLSIFQLRSLGWRLIYKIGTLVCLGLVTALYLRPKMLEETFPGWEGSFGVLLFSFALFSFTLSFVRLVKGGMVFAMWALLCLVIGSEVFLGKLPDEILSDEIKNVGGLFSGKSGWSNAGGNKKGLNIVSLGASSLGGIGVGKDGSYTERVSKLLSKNFGEGSFSLTELSEKNVDLGNILPAIKEKTGSLSPDIALFSDGESSGPKNEGWSGANSRGSGSAGFFGGFIGRITSIFNNSRLYTFLRQTVKRNFFGESNGNSERDNTRGRLKFDRLPTNISVVEFDKEIERNPYDLLIVGERVLSKEGHKKVAEALYRKILKMFGFPSAAQKSGNEGIPSKYFSFITGREELKHGITVEFELIDKTPSEKLLLLLNDNVVAESKVDENSGEVHFDLAETINLPIALKVGVKVLGPKNEEILFCLRLVKIGERNVEKFGLF